MEQEHKQLVIGILAHVDSGKTTLSEALLSNLVLGLPLVAAALIASVL